MKVIFYLCISFFAFQCAASDSPKITDSKEEKRSKKRAKNTTETEQYVEELISTKEKSSPDLGLNKENILITDLQSELHTNKAEIQKLRSLVRGLDKQLNKQIKFSSSELWSSPFSIYNQEVLMQSGTTYYGNIIYQDEALVTLETMIGKLNLDRTKIVRVISHKTDALDDIVELPELEGMEELPEIEDGSVIYKKPAEIILLGNISSMTDDKGNTKLLGKVKNTGGKRADFVKLNITLYRDWSQSLSAKTFSIFVDGEMRHLDPTDSTLVSLSSLSPKAEASFELHVPQNFGTVMSWTYDIDYEEYEK